MRGFKLGYSRASGTIQLADIPDKLIAYKNRIEEIEAELTP